MASRYDGGWIVAVLAVIISLTISGCSGSGPSRPSIILITLDTLRADHLGCYGYSRARTPNIDAFADRSIRFEHASTVSNNTLPAHAAMLTGRYPHSIGVPRNSFPLGPAETTLATILQAEGYATAAFVSASALASGLGLDRGFDLYDETFGVREMDQEQRRAATTTDAVLSWLDQRPKEMPFFLWVHYFDPHYPYTPPAPFDQIYETDYDGPADGSMEYLCTIWGMGRPKITPDELDLQRLIDLYDGEIAYLDAELGRLLERLDTPQLRRNSAVVITADHGESLTEHDYLFDHGRYLYEPSVHVPLLLRLPEGSSERRVIDGQTQVHDIFPTLLSIAGSSIPTGCEGIDLLPQVRDGHPSARRYSFAESCRPWEVEELYPDSYRNMHKTQTVIEEPWKLIVTPFEGKIELYDKEDDPGELVNRADLEPAKVAELYQQLRNWRKGNLPPGGPPDPENLERLRSLGYTR